MDEKISYNNYSLDNTCRTCACSYNNEDLFPLFIKRNEEKPVDLVEKFHTNNFKICENDKLPTNICKNCFRNFKILYDFIIQCECSEETLKNYFENVEELVYNFDLDNNNVYGNKSNSINENENNCLSNLKIETISNSEYYNSDESVELMSLENNFIDEIEEYLEENCEDKQNQITILKENILDNGNYDSTPIIKNDEDNSNNYSYSSIEYVTSNYSEKNYNTENEPEEILCKICNVSVYRKYYNSHMQKHRPVIFMHCEICNKIIDDIEMHNKIVHKIFLCKICNISFSNARKQRAHIFKMHDRTGYNCNICERVFLYPNILKRHLEYVHSKDTPQAICDICGKLVKNHSVLLNHRATHFKNTNINKDDFGGSKQQISEIKSFKCPFCSFKFRNLYGLKNHSKFHRKDKNSENYKHVCKFCNQRFKRSDHLHLHIDLVHLKNLPFTCTFCPKKFPKQYVLNQHIRKCHTEGPRECQYCKKPYSTRSSLNRHIKLHHLKEKTFKCDICGEVYSTVHKYETHMKTHTLEEEKETAKRIYAEMFLHET